MIAFSVTCKHLHGHCIRLSSFSYTFLSSLHSPFSSLIHVPFSSRSLALRVSFIHLYRQLYSTLLSHPLTSIGTPHIDIITSIDHHFFCSLLLSPPLPLNMPVRGLYGHGKGSYGHGHGKGSYGHGLAHTLPVPALCGHGKWVSALAGFIFCFVFLLMKDIMGSHSYCHDVTLNILSCVYIFQHTVTRLLLNLENTSHFFQ